MEGPLWQPLSWQLEGAGWTPGQQPDCAYFSISSLANGCRFNLLFGAMNERGLKPSDLASIQPNPCSIFCHPYIHQVNSINNFTTLFPLVFLPRPWLWNVRFYCTSKGYQMLRCKLFFAKLCCMKLENYHWLQEDQIISGTLTVGLNSINNHSLDFQWTQFSRD